jgi:ribonuclease BN (tRNA processing enzyme)
VSGPGGTTPLTFLGSGNFHAMGGYWSSCLIDRRLLIESPPSVLRNLRLVGADLAAIEALFLSHFHADHTFGWPFLHFSALTQARRQAELWVVGPPGLAAFLDELVRAGRIDHVVNQVRREQGGFPLHCLEVNEQEQRAGRITFRAVRVDHDPTLDCYGFLIQYGGRTIGYSGDTTLCDGLRRIAAAADVLIVECNSHDEVSPVHLREADLRTLRAEFPELPFVVTHRDPDETLDGLARVHLPRDFETIEV